MLYTQSNIHLILKIANGFEFLPVDVNLGRCQRYFYLLNGSGVAAGAVRNVISAYFPILFPLEMRTTPSAVLLSGLIVMPADVTFTITSIGTFSGNSRTIRLTGEIATSSLTAGFAVFIQCGTAKTDGIQFSAEL